ncbi:MAG: Sec-independent protein translocase protein TatB [Hyphomicrobium sp.]
MFEISWSELLILGIVTLIFVGPKELPVFLRTLGRYAGAMKRHASEFRAQFDAAMREAELETMQKEVEAMQASVNAEVMSAKTSLAEAAQPPPASSPAASAAPQLKSAPAEDALPMPPMPAVPRMES